MRRSDGLGHLMPLISQLSAVQQGPAGRNDVIDAIPQVPVISNAPACASCSDRLISDR